MVHVELIYVAEDKTTVQIALSLPQGSTVSEAISASGLHQKHPETIEYAVGIYAKRVTLDTLLRDGDRVEVYRPLSLDPKEKRRQLAKIRKK